MSYFEDALRKNAEKQAQEPRRHDAAYASDASLELQVGPETQIHGTCLRKQYYRITETPQSNPPDQMTSFVAAVGEGFHTQVARVFFGAEMLAQEESRLWIPEVKVSGRLDLLIRPNPTGNLVGIEVKTVGGYYGRKGCITPTRDTPLYPRLYHLAQTVVYAEFFADKFTEWALLYIDRETGQYREHQILYKGHDDIWVNGEPSSVTPKAVYDRWHRLWTHVEGKQLPARDYELRYSQEKIADLAGRGLLNKDETARVKAGRKVDKGDIQCREFCEWRDQCWKVDK